MCSAPRKTGLRLESLPPFRQWAFIKFEDTLSSTISRLDDGLYRVNINAGGNILPTYQAFILNNWIEITKAEIPDSTSDCKGFLLVGDFESAPLRYFDPGTSTIKSLRNPYIAFGIKWSGAGTVFHELISFSPPIADEKPIPFTLTVSDAQFQGCKGEGETEYISKIPKAGFTADPTTGEAVLKVTFTNESINYDSVMWYFYKADSIIKEEAKDGVIDSIDFVLFDTSPVYEYEWCGLYQVKLVTVKINPTTGNCYDSIMGAKITVEESLVEAPNVFTPNGDGTNDVFAVKSKSLKSMSIRIYNRWGGLVHSWSYSNIRGRDYTYKHSVWDGRIGNRMASPGVYFYVIRAVGRDGVKQNKEGFVHLFRNKN